jgi:hypothetical protein
MGVRPSAEEHRLAAIVYRESAATVAYRRCCASLPCLPAACITRRATAQRPPSSSAASPIDLLTAGCIDTDLSA